MNTDTAQLREFAALYTQAWCSGDPARVAGFFSPEGSLRVNEDAPAVGRTAIAAVAQAFMTAFPDLCVSMDQLLLRGESVEYHWTLTGTNTGPGGTGRCVCISGYEEWQMGADGFITSSAGHFDAADYQKQLAG